MICEQIACGGDRNFAYIIGDENSGICGLVDPSYGTDMILERARIHGLRPDYVLNTHSHSDHTAGNRSVAEKTGARIAAHRLSGTPDIAFNDGDELSLGNLSIRIIHTPGHTLDSVCFLVGNICITGDTLFVGKIGGTFSEEDARFEYESLHMKLMKLDDAVSVYPGHDYGTSPVSSIGRERESNPFLLQPDIESFISLKKNWQEYKRLHGIT